MSNGKQSAYPTIELDRYNIIEPGLNKRELFAGMAMQGFFGNGELTRSLSLNKVTPKDQMNLFAKLSVEAADALLLALKDGE